MLGSPRGAAALAAFLTLIAGGSVAAAVNPYGSPSGQAIGPIFMNTATANVPAHAPLKAFSSGAAAPATVLANVASALQAETTIVHRGIVLHVAKSVVRVVRARAEPATPILRAASFAG